MNCFCLQVRSMRLFRSMKVPDVNAFAVYGNRRSPFFRMLGLCNAKQATRAIRCIGTASIVVVDKIAGFSKVFKPVVRPVPVDVVNMPIWQSSKCQRPRYAVGIHCDPCNSCRDVAACSCRNHIARLPVGQNASLRIVGKRLLKTAKINVAHAVAPLCNGLRSGGSVLVALGRCAIIGVNHAGR